MLTAAVRDHLDVVPAAAVLTASVGILSVVAPRVGDKQTNKIDHLLRAAPTFALSPTVRVPVDEIDIVMPLLHSNRDCSVHTIAVTEAARRRKTPFVPAADDEVRRKVAIEEDALNADLEKASQRQRKLPSKSQMVKRQKEQTDWAANLQFGPFVHTLQLNRLPTVTTLDVS